MAAVTSRLAVVCWLSNEDMRAAKMAAGVGWRP
jgi:hypothetical protein